MRLVAVCLAALVVALPARGQDGLRIHAVESGTGSAAVLGEVLLDLPLGTIQTVGLEEDADGTFAVTAWLTAEAAADLARVTAASAGSVVGVVYRGRVLHTPRVDSAVPNGLVTVPGLTEADGERLARALRGEPASSADAELDRLLGVDASEGASSEATQDPVSAAVPASPDSRTDGAGAVALDFVAALDRRDWLTAADLLHPDAQAMLRADALGALRLDGPTVRIRDGIRDGALPLAEVLPDARGPLDGLSARDLAALYFAGLDTLGAWGAPGPTRAVVGQVADGDVAHVLLRARDGVDAGASAVTVVTVRPDAQRTWRVLLTTASGF